MGSISSDKLIELVQSYGLPIIWAILIFIIGRIVARIISNTVAKMMIKSDIDETLVKFTKTLIYAALMVCVILSAL